MSLSSYIFNSMHQLNVLIQQHSFSKGLTESWAVPVKSQFKKSKSTLKKYFRLYYVQGTLHCSDAELCKPVKSLQKNVSWSWRPWTQIISYFCSFTE